MNIYHRYSNLSWSIGIYKKNMKKVYFYFFWFIFSLTVFVSCSNDDPKIPDWDWGGGETDGDAKPRYIWIDAAANFSDYANSKENIERDLTLAKNTGFTDIVVDVRPTMGDVLFKSSAVQEVKKLDYWPESGGYAFYERTATWDYLQAFIDTGHKLGLKVHAAINTFVAGNSYLYGLGEQGLLFRDETKRDWATTVNIGSGVKNVMDVSEDKYSTKFLNPVNEDVQEYILSILGDLAKYDVDGIFLDRCRFDGMTSDFSEYTHKKFEEYIGEKVTNFPADVMEPDMSEYNALPSALPPYFKRWLEFRVKVIHDFIVKARQKVKGVNNNIQFGVYVGAWYSNYYGVGVNWASPKYNTSAYYPKWATAKYMEYGYADHLDFLLLGAYASADKITGSTEWTIEGFCKLAGEKLMGDVKYAGGPDVGNWTVPAGTDVKAAVKQTVGASINNGNGYFLFDIIHMKKYNYWSDVKAGIDLYLASLENSKK